MKKKRADGTYYYYYYKKKIGRKKKVGRKRKKKETIRYWLTEWNFKIIKTQFNQQSEFIGVFHDFTEVEQAKQILINENNKVKFPKHFTTSKPKGSDFKNSLQLKDEYLLLEKVREITEDTILTNDLYDEFGNKVTHSTSSEKWRIYDKIPCLTEETFWVYRYNPHSDRKTYQWIFNNLIIKPLYEKYVIIQILRFNNKIVLRHDNQHIDMIICKNPSDAIYFYNLLQTDIENNKIPNIYPSGSITCYDERGKTIINELLELTGWDKIKLCRHYS